jgi:ribosome biogenesis GTPase A
MNENKTNINWYPGHMARAKRLIERDLKLIDIVVEICDARIPVSSRSPVLRNLIKTKPEILLLNKCDMADKEITSKWIEYFKMRGITAIPTDCKTSRGINRICPEIKNIMSDKIEQWKEKGMVGRTVKVMIIGIPNVGKSSVINCLRKEKNGKAEVQNKPGITKDNKWFSVSSDFEFMDTPGVLWPNLSENGAGKKLAFTGAISENAIDPEDLACELLKIIIKNYPQSLTERYGVKCESFDIENVFECLCEIGKSKGLLIKGGETDSVRAANMLLNDFRTSKLGTISLEVPR